MNERFQKEIVRKSIHASGIFFIPFVFWHRTFFTIVFTIFLITTLCVELASKKGFSIPFLSKLAETCKREEEKNRLSRGAFFLLLAAIICPYLFGSTAAAIGLIQAFVGDSASTLIGMKYGKTPLFFIKNKTWVGSLAFFLTSFVGSLIFVNPLHALLLAAVGMIIESVSPSGWDNLSVPVGVGFLAMWI